MVCITTAWCLVRIIVCGDGVSLFGFEDGELQRPLIIGANILLTLFCSWWATFTEPSCYYQCSTCTLEFVSFHVCRLVNGSRMPAFFPLRATLPPVLRWSLYQTRIWRWGPIRICDRSKPTSVIYSTPFRRRVSSNSTARRFAINTSIFYPTSSAFLTCSLSVSSHLHK